MMYNMTLLCVIFLLSKNSQVEAFEYRYSNESGIDLNKSREVKSIEITRIKITDYVEKVYRTRHGINSYAVTIIFDCSL